MINIDVRVDLREAMKALESLRKDQIPFATAYALTQCAKAAQEDVEREIGRVFDRPTQFTLKAVRTKPATKRNLVAEVKLKDEAYKGNPAVRWLIAQIRGGARNIKGFEKLMQRAGVMPNGYYAIPTKNAPLDRYGNVPGSVINRILSQTRSSRDVLTRETAVSRARNIRRAKRRREGRYFSAVPSNPRTRHLKPGIWERVSFGFGESIRPVFLFSSTPPTYTKRLPFEEIVQRAVKRELARQFARGFQLAQSTMRPPML